MFAVSRDLMLFLTDPTVRTLRFLSCPPRSLPTSAHLMSLERATARSRLRQSAMVVIALDPLIDVKAVRARGVSACKTRNEPDG
jgi:hypothetical protein